MRTHPRLRRAAAVVSALTPALVLGVSASSSHAADPTPFYVVGTSDVSDSNLMAAVIEPGFEKAYPQYDLRYQGTGTSNAIKVAQTGGAAALLVHAASVENQFVQQGYSLEGPGRSIFWGDYVLVGPTADPAGVANGGEHDIVTAFQKVAAAGLAGTAKFYERTTSPGTSIQERQIWALTTGVPLCTVGAASGGGARPTNGPTTCTNPDDNTSYPAWYQGNAANQAANLALTSTCVAQGGSCYDFVDRGTFDYQQSIGNATNLKVLTRDNAASAKGGQSALVNAFHAYGINPAAVPAGSKTDATAAKLFLDFLTSPAEQQQIGYYLGKDKPFVPAAAPDLTAGVRGGTASSAGTTVIKGNLSNVIPGYPALSGQTVNLLKASSDDPLAIPQVVASAKTNYKGNYKLRVKKLKPGKYYSVGVGSITKVEDPSLVPPFSDVLQPTSTSLGQAAKVVLKPLAARGHVVSLSGRFTPKAHSTKGRLLVYAAHPGRKLKRVDATKVGRTQSHFDIRTTLGTGTWRIELVFKNHKKDLIPTASQIRTVTIS